MATSQQFEAPDPKDLSPREAPDRWIAAQQCNTSVVQGHARNVLFVNFRPKFRARSGQPCLWAALRPAEVTISLVLWTPHLRNCVERCALLCLSPSGYRQKILLN